MTPLSADFETGDFSQIAVNATVGSVSLTGGGYGDATSARATYNGGGGNGYARVQWDIGWNEGDDVWYSAAYFLPTGFKASMQGQVALMRWDDWPSHPNDRSDGGIVIWGADKRARLVRELLPSGTVNVLSTPFDLPEGRWFWLEVHQHLSSAGSALNEVYLDGNLIDRTTGPNTYAGRVVERIRYGIPAIADGAQTNPLTLQFDRPTVSTSQTGPNPSLVQPPTTTPPPTTTTTTTTTTSTPPPTTTTTTTTTTPPPTTTTTTTTTTRKPHKKRSSRVSAAQVTPRVRKCVRAALRRAVRRGDVGLAGKATQRCVSRYGRAKAARHR